ncbi:MAG: RNA polymerase sigma factor (sigma-70 family) [Planctomycetota bacterium]
MSSANASIPELPELGRSVELVREFQEGNELALNELFERYQERVRRIVGVRLGRELRRFLEEEDIVQEVFLVAARRIGEFEPTGHSSILYWLSAIAENRIRDSARYHQSSKRDAYREQRLGLSDSEPGAPEPISPAPSPSQQNIFAEIGQIVDESLSQLEPVAYREVILSRDYYGSSWEEVCKSLERKTVAAAQELYRRAHAKLQVEVVRRVEQ